MKKKIKKLNIFSSLSFLPLMPLVAASCKKNDNDEKIQIINNESNPQTSKQMTPNSHGDQSKDDSSNVDKTTDAKNNNEKSEPTVTPKDQSDESRSRSWQKW
nr:variable surface lipoprotein [Mycoplasmopsis bovis]